MLTAEAQEIERNVGKYGEKYRQLITDCILWLEFREPLWELEKTINRDEFIKHLIYRVRT